MHKETEKHHILVIDDDNRICELVSRYLQENNFVVMSAQNTKQARKVMHSFQFDALVVDVMMPEETGLEFTKDIKKQYDTPVLLLTALGDVDDRIHGFEMGADDYLPKPFEPKELVMRLNAILRRTHKVIVDIPSFKIGNWTFNAEQAELDNGQDVVRLTSVETTLLKALAGQAGQVVSREELAKISGIDAGERTIDVQVTRLRKKIEEDTKAPRFLQTVRGKGYLLRIEEL